MDTYGDSNEVAPHFIKQVSPEFKTTVVEFENGWESRFANQHAGRATYRFEWKRLNLTEMLAIKDFFDVQLGAFKAWYFQDNRISEKTLSLRFKTDKLIINKPENAYMANISVEVVIC